MNESTNTPYYVLYSSTIRNSSLGLRPRAALSRDDLLWMSAEILDGKWKVGI